MEETLQDVIHMCYLQVIMLSLLLSFQVKTCQSPQVLLAHCFVHSGSAADSLTVVVGCVCPPVSFGLDIAQDHVLNGSGQAWHLRQRKRLKNQSYVHISISSVTLLYAITILKHLF